MIPVTQENLSKMEEMGQAELIVRKIFDYQGNYQRGVNSDFQNMIRIVNQCIEEQKTKSETQIALGKFRMRRLIWLVEQSVFKGVDDSSEEGYASITDYVEDRANDIKEGEQWIKENE